MSTDLPLQAPRQRLDLIDALRGLALSAMVVFHFSWDLSNADLIATDISNSIGWQWFARSIAASFLIITGVSLVLAHGNSFNRSKFLRRWLMLAGAAALVTLGTFFAFPESYVFFGILHHIALANLIALPFLRLPPMFTLASAGLSLTLPLLIHAQLLDPPWLIWTGLAERVPDTVDFVPFFPWIGCVLAGVALGRMGRAWLEKTSWQAANPLTKCAATAGRHSLGIYLIHQPILLGLIWLYSQIVPLPAAMDFMQSFETECQKACFVQGGSTGHCAQACNCTREAASKEISLEAAVRAGKLDIAQTAKLNELAQICSRKSDAKP